MTAFRKNRLLAFLLALTLVFSVMTFSAFAEGETPDDAATTTETAEQSTSAVEDDSNTTAAEGSTTADDSTTAGTVTTTASASDDKTDDTKKTEKKKWSAGKWIEFIITIIILASLVIFAIIKREKLVKFVRGLNSERKKVVWMSLNQVKKNTLVVVAIIVALAIVIFLLDFAFGSGVDALNSFMRNLGSKAAG